MALTRLLLHFLGKWWKSFNCWIMWTMNNKNDLFYCFNISWKEKFQFNVKIKCLSLFREIFSLVIPCHYVKVSGWVMCQSVYLMSADTNQSDPHTAYICPHSRGWHLSPTNNHRHKLRQIGGLLKCRVETIIPCVTMEACKNIFSKINLIRLCKNKR